MSWYEEAFRHDYLLVYPHRDEAAARAEVEFALRVCGLRPPAPILDLCCGFGRHSKIFFEKGFHTVGCDLSADLLAHFAKRVDGLPDKPMMVRSDSRQLPFLEEKFKAVFSFFQSFGYFESPAEDRHVVEEASRVLLPGGYFLLDLMNPNYALAHLEPTSVQAAGGMKMVQRRRYDPMRHKIVKTITLSMGEGTERSWREEVRLYSKETITEFFQHARLTPVDWFGDFMGKPYTEESPRLIALAQRKTF